MTQHTDRPIAEDLIDEATAESFPASDPPAWTAVHAGLPTPRPLVLEHGHELRTSLRTDLERFEPVLHGSEGGGATREDLTSLCMLEAGRAVIREPIDPALRARNVESEWVGTAPDAPDVVVGARYDSDDPSGLVVGLAVLRVLAHERLRSTLRFVAFAGGGSAAYVERLRRNRRSVGAMLFLTDLDLSRARSGRETVLFAGNLHSASVARTARDAFRSVSRINARALALPSWFPGFMTNDHAAFWRQGWPGVLVTERAPWVSSHRSGQSPDVDRMAAAVPGLVAAVVRLAGGRV